MQKQLADKKTRKLKELLTKIFSLIEPTVTVNWQDKYGINFMDGYNKEYFFYIESKKLNTIFSLNIKNNEIVCGSCNSRTCKHVIEVYTDPKLEKLITQHGIILNKKFYEYFLRNISNLRETVENYSNNKMRRGTNTE